MSTKRPKPPTVHQFMARFPTDDACLEHLMRVRWGERHHCVKCNREARYYRVKSRRSYECEHCGYQVYPTAGTPFERTRTSLKDWFFVMFLFCASRNGVAAKEVQRQIGVTYKTAWRMCHAIRLYIRERVFSDFFVHGLQKTLVVFPQIREVSYTKSRSSQFFREQIESHLNILREPAKLRPRLSRGQMPPSRFEGHYRIHKSVRTDQHGVQIIHLLCGYAGLGAQAVHRRFQI